MVGSSLLRVFKKRLFTNIITRTKSQLNLLDQKKTFNFLKNNKIEYMIIAAAKVGGIHANDSQRAKFLYENLQIQNNLIHGSYLAGIKKIIFLGSSCIYPKKSKLPIKEEYLLTGPLEYTNEPYAVAKIAGLKLCENYNNQYKGNYLCLMPCNLYGPNDNFDLLNSHFLPAILKKIYTAKKNSKKYVQIWGDGTARREIMHVDDLAYACLYFLNIKTKNTHINIGSGEEFSISDYAKIISKIVGYTGKIKYDNKMPNGTHRKILNSKLAKSYGWSSSIKFNKGLLDYYKNFLKI